MDGIIAEILDFGLDFIVTTRGRQECGPGWRLGPRVIPDHLIYFLESGVFEARVEDDKFRIEPERVFWLKPGVEHFFHVPAGGAVTVNYFRFFLGQKKEPDRPPKAYDLFDPSPGLLPLFHAMLPVNSPQGDYEIPYLRSQLGVLFSKILGEQGLAETPGPGLKARQRKSALDFARRNLTRRFTLQEWAAAAGLNFDYFSRQFRKRFNMTPQEWIKRERIRLACDHLLESGLSVSGIAEKLGYGDLFFFSRQFKEVMGESPAQWRARAGS